MKIISDTANLNKNILCILPTNHLEYGNNIFNQLPEYVKDAITDVLNDNPEFLTHEGSKGKCIIASDLLLFKCDELLTGNNIEQGYCSGGLEGLKDYNGRGPHHWAVIDNFRIDLTARQFDENADCPKIWKNNY